jgi:hypothetical protein
VATGPFQSKLTPHLDRIAALRDCKPPVTYAGIAAILKAEHQIIVHRATIQRFVKVRSARALYRLETNEVSKAPASGIQKTTGQVPEEVLAQIAKLKGNAIPRDKEREPYLPKNGRLTYKEKS